MDSHGKLVVIYLGRQTETCCPPHCTRHRRLSAGMYPCGIRSLAENCKVTKASVMLTTAEWCLLWVQEFKQLSHKYISTKFGMFLNYFTLFLWFHLDLLRHLLWTDTTALSMRKTGASTSALLSLKERQELKNKGIKLSQQLKFLGISCKSVLDVRLDLSCLTSVSMWVKLCLPFRADEAVANKIWVRISLWSTSCVSGWVSTARKTNKTQKRWYLLLI